MVKFDTGTKDTEGLNIRRALKLMDTHFGVMDKD